jgi:predicted ABC-type ATPase
MLDFSFLSARPIVVALAGSNGAGKSTFFEAFLTTCGLRFVNADELAKQLAIGPYEAAQSAAAMRSALIAKKQSFIFETVFSDPVGEKVEMLRGLTEQGYEVVVIFIQIEDVGTSIQRVSMRVQQGGHDVPDDKLLARFERTQRNLKRAIKVLPNVLVFDNSNLADPYRHVATYRNGVSVHQRGV